MLIQKLEIGFWNGKNTSEENVIFFEKMTKNELFSMYDKIMKALSTESISSISDARGRANIAMDCWKWVHNERGWYDIYDDDGSYNPYPIRYITKESVQAIRDIYE